MIYKYRTFIFIVIAFIFSVSIRMLWVFQLENNPQSVFNNEFMLTTPDGYFFAKEAKDILLNQNIEDTRTNALSELTAFVVGQFNIKFESFIFYISIFLSSLIVIPIILIGKSIQKECVGFIAALIGSITWSYYNRTMAGYFDTDMLNIVLPMFLLWSLIYAIRTKKDIYILISGFEVILYRWWYPQSYSLEFAFVALILIYTLYLFFKKVDYKTELKLIIVMIFAVVQLPEIYRIFLVILTYIGYKTHKLTHYLFWIFGIAVVLLFATGGIDPIISQLQSYMFRADTVISSLNFYNVFSTVKEAQSIPFTVFANRISGHSITFILSVIGYILLVKKHKEILLAIPMLLLGFSAYGIPGIVPSTGLRFTIYAVPIMSLGIAFFIYILITTYIKSFWKYIIIMLSTLFILYPNIKHLYEYRVWNVFNTYEVEILDNFSKISDKNDYILSWWDYGYILQYYTNTKTLIDNGKNGGDDSYPVSFALMKPQELSAKMARLAVEYTEKQNSKDSLNSASSILEQMMLDYGFKDVNKFLSSLDTNISLPKKTTEVYFYLPYRMLDYFNAINLFSNINLANGKKLSNTIFYKTQSKNQTNYIAFNKNIVFSKGHKDILFNGKKLPINSFITTEYDIFGRNKVKKETFDSSSELYVIHMKSYKTYLLLDKKAYNSTFIQLFVLENYNKELFTPVTSRPMVKIYKLKI